MIIFLSKFLFYNSVDCDRCLKAWSRNLEKTVYLLLTLDSLSNLLVRFLSRVDSSMYLKTFELFEKFPTGLTLILWSVSVMGRLMFLQVTLSCERLGTFRAAEWTLARVASQMNWRKNMTNLASISL